MQGNTNKFITLKEAAKISGYAPDYIGQLIRKGKLPGKQIYSSVAWVTTEEALREYMQREHARRGKSSSLSESMGERVMQFKNEVAFEFENVKFFRYVLYGAIGLSVVISLLLFYIFSVSFDKELERRAIERMESLRSVDEGPLDNSSLRPF
ncbi:MAG: hypothetical protein A2934_01705 [Candidatus Sungbacteria bacterium RIFCSPLOWO2_01_FULL_47_10]|uniref:Helix-turn-helix domain-containing protein n=1 Tax=Candidatus Sungbacteria bacterium RIFCSPLOWO2_01_FULL_47_10 TaxID=1802276 RepID=A0A1G2L1I7_9BACT|nr:MAG: hypothetical protein A2934_01705 [Candidatus Sungbacteria bacterium RIFCSPLOWO2_01_FULL_47_10]